MLTDGQKNYLSKLSPEQASRIVVIKPYDPQLSVIADAVITKIKKQIPDADIRYMGASALGISGQNDVDIYVICPKSLKEEYLGGLAPLFGEQIKNKWHWFDGCYEVSVYLSDPEDHKFKEQLDIFSLFKTDPEVLREYEQLKTSMNGKTYKEYQIGKYEFYNRVLKIN